MKTAEEVAKFRPLKTLKVTCKECGHVGNLEVNEIEANTTAVNFVAKIRHSARAEGITAGLEEAAKVAEQRYSSTVRQESVGNLVASRIRALKAKP